MSTNKTYKRYKDYETTDTTRLWYKNLVFVTAITGALWAVSYFFGEMLNKQKMKNISLPIVVFGWILIIALLCLGIITIIAVLTV